MTTGHSPYRAHRSSPFPLILAGAACAMAAYMLWERNAPGSLLSDAEPRAITPRGDLADYEKDTIAVYESNRRSVVHITKEVRIRTLRGIQTREEGTGSGFIWDDRGYVVTNYHVVRGNDTMLVRLHDGQEFDARVVDVRSDLDIAVLKLNSLPSQLQPVTVGTSRDLKVGQAALAIGNPFGLDQSLSTGVISALDRSIESVIGTPIRGMIQVDAAINPGNSGGPLLDSAGRLIGMNTAIKSPSGASAGIGFAVPVDTINRIVPELIEGNANRLLLGFQPSFLLVEGVHRVGINRVLEGGGAQAAGLRNARLSRGGDWMAGDIILRVAGQEVQTLDDISRVLTSYSSGERVPVTIRRSDDGQRWQDLEVDIELVRAGDLQGDG